MKYVDNVYENVLSKNNGRQYPTGIFQHLLNNDTFARQYVRRAKQLLADDGLLGEASVVALWDSLYNTISTALYDEAARWGDYRRDVHRWQSAGHLYTVDDYYQAERERLLTEYFPFRSDWVLEDILSYVDIDDTDDDASIVTTPSRRHSDRQLYNLQGQAVSRPRPGLYIRNGKVVIFKK